MSDRAVYTVANAADLPIADKSVHMIATSPPYWGLRDYGTATWEGGDPECEHRFSNQPSDNKAPGAIKSGVRPGIDNRTCQLCGAVRVDDQIGLEPVHDCGAWATGAEPCGECFVCSLVAVFREFRRVLRDDGTLWLNLGDSYAGYKGVNYGVNPEASNLQKDSKVPRAHSVGTPVNGLKPKDLCGIPQRVVLALQADGWYWRSEITWCKTAPMPESVKDRPTNATEKIFLLTKSARYFYDNEAVKVAATTDKNNGWLVSGLGATYNDERNHNGQGATTLATIPADGRRNLWNYWLVGPAPYSGAHYATWPPALVETMIKAGSSERGVCPVCGAPWRRVVSKGEATNRPDNPNDVQPYTANGAATNGTGATTLHKARRVETVDWRPTCDHDAQPVPAVVLDPFAGSGTTLMVARQLGRIGLGFDLSEKYLYENCRVRLGHDKLAAWGNGINGNGANGYHDMPLFARANGNGGHE